MKNANVPRRSGSGFFAALSGIRKQDPAPQYVSSLDLDFSALVANNILNFIDIRLKIFAAFKENENHRKPMTLLMVAIDELAELRSKLGDEAAERADRFMMTLLSYHRNAYFGSRNKVLIGQYVPGRYLILLPDMTGATGGNIAEYLRKAISENAFVCNSRQIGLTVSIGVVHKPGHNGDQDFMVLQADRACAEAERTGGDRIVFGRCVQPDKK